MMTGNHKSHCWNRDHAGISLIEVLVAIVVLTIGILAVIRIFPGGFLSIQRTSEMGQAQALVQQQIDAQKQQPSVAESIVAPDPTDPNYPNGSILSEVMPDDLTDLSYANPPSGVTSASAYYASNINHYRKIIGENFRISVPSSNTAMGFGATYILQQGPVYNKFSTIGGQPADSLRVYGMSLERVEQRSVANFNQPTVAPFLRNDSQYAIDSQNRKIAFFPRIGTGIRQFYFSYDYFKKDGSGNIAVVSVPNNFFMTVPDVNPMTLGPGQIPVPIWRKIFDEPTDSTGPITPMDLFDFKLNSEAVSQRFRLVSTMAGTKPTFDPNEPYEYAWYSNQFTNVNANAGVIVFNPVAFNTATPGSYSAQPLTARVDYATYDNHIIHEDRLIPSNGPYDVRLSLQRILKSGYIGDNTSIYDSLTTYNGMLRDAGANTPDMLIYNANTGDKVSDLTAGVVTGVRFILDDRAGIVRFNQADIETNNLQSASLRIYYRAEKEWGTQLQKASAHYFQTDTAAGVDYKSYYLGQTTDSAVDPDAPHRVYFALCDAGKSVVLGEYNVEATVMGSPNNPVKKRFTNEGLKINDDPAQFVSFGNRTLTWANLSDVHSEAKSEQWVWDYKQSGRAVGNLRGGSIRSRVVWKDAARWRKLDNDTFLSQKSP